MVQRTSVCVSVVGLGAMGVIALVIAAGPLNPPAGPVSSTYKTLGQVEPRTPISSLPFTISQPGSYYLTGNLTGAPASGGIAINASNVTIDLCGFAITGAGAGSGTGIASSFSRSNIRIMNGTVSNWGSAGVNLYDTDSFGNVVENIMASSNTGYGIATGFHSTLRSCTADSNTGDGFRTGPASTFSLCVASQCNIGFDTGRGASLTGCAAAYCTYGFAPDVGTTITGSAAQFCVTAGFISSGACTLDACAASNTSGGAGFTLGQDSSAHACVSTLNSADGITASDGCTIDACTLTDNGDDGVQVHSGCTVRGCTMRNNGPTAAGAGVFMTGIGSRVEDNHAQGNRTGFLLGGGTGNFIVRNTATGNGTNYNIGASQNAAPIVTNPGAGGFAGTTPWSNFAF